MFRLSYIALAQRNVPLADAILTRCVQGIGPGTDGHHASALVRIGFIATAALKGYLYAQIGRRWDTVYSEIREQFDPNSVTQLHILGHVFSTPARLIVGIPRTPVIPRGWVVRGRISPNRISCGRWGWWSIVIANIRWCWGGWGGACRETNQQSRDQDFFDHFPSSLFIAEGGRHR
jgi:hypothetical protein